MESYNICPVRLAYFTRHNVLRFILVVAWVSISLEGFELRSDRTLFTFQKDKSGCFVEETVGNKGGNTKTNYEAVVII